MPRNANDQGGGGGFRPEFKIHNAVLCQLVDLGTHEKEWNNKPTGILQNKINFGFEFVDETQDGDNGPYNPIWGMGLTNSLGKKANMRKLLEGWRGKPFNEEELKNFDISVLLGRSCQLVIQANGKGNPKIVAITNVKESHNGLRTLQEFWVEEGCFDNEFPEWMPEWMEEELKSSKEYTLGLDFADSKETAPGETHAAPSNDIDDDIPF